MKHADIIEELGGPTAVARALGSHHSRPVRWQQKGIPPRRWSAVVDLAKKLGRTDITFDLLAKPEKPA